MNTKIYYSLYTLFVAGALLASGCSNDDDTYDFYAAHPDAVRFHITAGDMPQSRVNTESDGSSFDPADQIAISADGGTSYSNYVQSSGDDWVPAAGQSYLRWKEETLSFQAYYPVTEGTDYTHFTVPTSQPDQVLLRKADYMTAEATNQSPDKPVALAFQHRLAKVTVSVTLIDELKDKRIFQLTFHTKGHKLENGNITDGNVDVKYFPYYVDGKYMVVLPPQSENNSAAFIKINLDKTADYTFTGIPELEPGKAYTLALQVGHDGVKLVRPITVEDWGNKVDMTGGTATLKPEYYSWYLKDPNAETFTLSNATELREFAKLVNGDQEALDATGRASGYNFDQKTVQIADTVTKELDLKGAEWTPIGTTTTSFSGTFNGNGKTVSEVKINIASGYNVGFFAQLDGGSVKNLCVKGNVTAETSSQVGGIVGKLSSGTVEHCAFHGTVEGSVTVGGIAGWNQRGTITACFASGSVKAASSRVGGIVGLNYKTLTHCYSSAEVTAKGTNSGSAGGIAGVNNGNISHCYAMGKITANIKAGGIAGESSPDCIISNCVALNAEIVRSASGQFFGRVVGDNFGTITDNAAWTGMTLPDGFTPTDNADGIHGKSLTATECLTKTTYITYGFDENEWAFSDQSTWDYLPWNRTLYQYWGNDVRIAVPSYLQ